MTDVEVQQEDDDRIDEGGEEAHAQQEVEEGPYKGTQPGHNHQARVDGQAVAQMLEVDKNFPAPMSSEIVKFDWKLSVIF